MLEAGRGVEQSDERAVQICMTASQAGYGWAEYKLANCLHYGQLGIQHNFHKAV